MIRHLIGAAAGLILLTALPAEAGQLPLKKGGAPAPVPLHDVQVHEGVGVDMPSAVVELTGRPLQAYLVQAGPEGAQPAVVGNGHLDASGQATLQFGLAPELMGQSLQVRALFVHRRTVVEAGPANLGNIGQGECEPFDFERYPCPPFLDGCDGAIPTTPGEVVALQWLADEVVVFGESFNANHPGYPVIFDSANPSGGDWDLLTPVEGDAGDGIEPTPYDHVLIVQENDLGCESPDPFGGTICDEADDDGWGGALLFLFVEAGLQFEPDGIEPAPRTLCTVDLLDIDEDDGALVITFGLDGEGQQPAILQQLAQGDVTPQMLHQIEQGPQDGGGIVDFVPVPPGPDNGLQRVFLSPAPVVGMLVLLSGSGAVAEFSYRTLDF